MKYILEYNLSFSYDTSEKDTCRCYLHQMDPLDIHHPMDQIIKCIFYFVTDIQIHSV